MSMNEISPFTAKSGESLKYSDSEYTKDEYRDTYLKRMANTNYSRHSSMEMDGGDHKYANNSRYARNHMNSDLDEH